jgi:cytochrome c
LKNAVPEDDNTNEQLKNYRDGSRRISTSSGRFGLIFLFLALYFIVAAISVTTYSTGEDGIFENLFAIKVVLRFIQFLIAAITITGGAIFFAYFSWEGGKKITDEKHRAFIKKNALYLTFIGALLLPVLLCVDIFVLPETVLSGAVFIYAILALFLLFIVYHFLYSMIRNSDLKFSGPVFYLILVSLLAIIVKDQLAMGNALKPNAVILSARYDTYLLGLEGGNKGAAAVSGEQIFKNICSSCHSFDHKIVGPPYKQTLPKYEGHLNQLVSFIRNPSKMNPDYPPMPNPGLRPNEAQAVAEWLLKTYKTK